MDMVGPFGFLRKWVPFRCERGLRLVAKTCLLVFLSLGNDKLCLAGRKSWCSLSEVFELSVLFAFSAQRFRIGPWLSSGG